MQFLFDVVVTVSTILVHAHLLGEPVDLSELLQASSVLIYKIEMSGSCFIYFGETIKGYLNESQFEFENKLRRH